LDTGKHATEDSAEEKQRVQA
jgi:hypothetical protein